MGARLFALTISLAVLCGLAQGEAADPRSTDNAPARRTVHRASGTTLNDHIRILTKALDLDAMQQSQLRSVLESQRAQLRKLWSDSTVPAEYRVGASRRLSDQTADRIRALLTEEQRKKYNPHVERHSTAPGAGEKTVEDWMNAAKAKSSSTQPEPSAAPE